MIEVRFCTANDELLDYVTLLVILLHQYPSAKIYNQGDRCFMVKVDHLHWSNVDTWFWQDMVDKKYLANWSAFS